MIKNVDIPVDKIFINIGTYLAVRSGCLNGRQLLLPICEVYKVMMCLLPSAVQGNSYQVNFLQSEFSTTKQELS